MANLENKIRILYNSTILSIYLVVITLNRSYNRRNKLIKSCEYDFYTNEQEKSSVNCFYYYISRYSISTYLIKYSKKLPNF